MRIKKLAKQVLFEVNKLSYRRRQFINEIDKRSHFPLTSISALSKNISIFSAFSTESHTPNDFYGHATIIKKFLNIPVEYQFKFVIEHGVTLSKQINNLELDSSLSSYLTFSKYRTKVLKQSGKLSHSIGPYIYYSNHYLTREQLKNEKKRLGRCLLVLPSHSTLDIQANYDIERFCREIQKMGKNFQSIVICLYWKDILHGADKIYKLHGFECVTAGHILDPNFLPRLKSIIELSDFTISNDPGTHVGYCILMNKPHLIIPQKQDMKGLKSEVDKAYAIQQAKPYKEVMEAFCIPNDKITTKQYKVVNEYWGLNQIKDKKSLQEIVDFTEEIYQNRLKDL